MLLCKNDTGVAGKKALYFNIKGAFSSRSIAYLLILIEISYCI